MRIIKTNLTSKAIGFLGYYSFILTKLVDFLVPFFAEFLSLSGPLYLLPQHGFWPHFEGDVWV